MKKRENKKNEEKATVNKKDVKKMISKNKSEDNNEIKSFIIILIIIAVIIGIIYGLTEFFNKNENKNTDEIVTGEINYDKLTVGTILNRPYENYYVLIYNSDDSKAVIYSTILSKYMQKSTSKDYVKIYFCDLANNLNNKYYNVNQDGNSNLEAKTVEEFNFGDLTLLKIKNGKIVEYIENFENIKEILK